MPIVESPPSAQAAISQPSEVINESGIPIGRDITIDMSGQQFMSLYDLTKIFFTLVSKSKKSLTKLFSVKYGC